MTSIETCSCDLMIFLQTGPWLALVSSRSKYLSGHTFLYMNILLAVISKRMINRLHQHALNTYPLSYFPVARSCAHVEINISPSRSLWSMRSYIHVHLCLSLMAAQLVFVVGVDKTSNQVGVLIVTISMAAIAIVCMH